MLVGGNGMTDDALDASTKQFIQSFDAGVDHFHECYSAALAHNPSVAGHVTAHVVIARDGSVYDLQQKEVALADARMVACVFAAFRKLRYTPPAGDLFAADAKVSFTPQ